MIQALFGNRNIERVLLFLLVNEKCYGTQLQTILGIPLTPVQRALAHLEKHDIIACASEGKAKIYRMNPSWPLRWELEALLKKTYLLLPADEKRKYCFVQEASTQCNSHLRNFWKRLLDVRALNLHSKSRSMHAQSGKAEITVEQKSPAQIIFHEKGYWYTDQNPSVAFTSAFQWQFGARDNFITLEHLRQGPKHPVFLFNLTASKPNQLVSVDAHLCGDDTYLGHIKWDHEQIAFNWRIIGPHKNEELTYIYT